MAKKIASDIRFLYDGYDPGTSTVRASVTLESEVLDPTSVVDAAERAMAGSRKDGAEWAGLFDDAAGDMDAAQAVLLGTGTSVMSLLIGTAIGDRAYSGTGYLLSAKNPAKLGGLVQQEAGFKPDQAIDRGQVIGYRIAKGTAANYDPATGSLDNGTPTGAGGVLYAHVHAVGGGTLQVGINHSVDATTWNNPANSQNFSTSGSEKVVFSGTLRRYVRGWLSGTGTGTATILLVRN